MAKVDPLVQIATRVPLKVAGKLNAQAQRNERSAAAEMRIAIYKHLGLVKDAA